MEKLSIEEKAKRYDEAIERANSLLSGNELGNAWIYKVLPELKESEGERIRKELIAMVRLSCTNGDDADKKIAWLKKQSIPQVRTGLEWVNTIDDACDKRYSEEYAHGEYCHEQSFKWGFQEGVDWLEKQGEQKYTQRDIDDAYLKGIADVKREVEKIDEQTEKMKKEIAEFIFNSKEDIKQRYEWIKCLGFDVKFSNEEKQGEQKPAQEINPFEAEHGKYYYCIKDYFCGGRKQASKGDVVQALRELPIMGLKDASEYFLPVNFIKCNSTWSEEDEKMIRGLIVICDEWTTRHPFYPIENCEIEKLKNWLKSLKDRVQPKQKKL